MRKGNKKITEDAIAILSGALKVFGRTGERWIQGDYVCIDVEKIPEKWGFDEGDAYGDPEIAARLLQTKRGGVEACSYGGIQIATVQLGLKVQGNEYYEAEELLETAIKEETKYSRDIVGYNDYSSRKWLDIKKVFKRAVCLGLEKLERKGK